MATNYEQQQQQEIDYNNGTMNMQSSSNSPSNGNSFIGGGAASAYDLGELDQPLFLYLDGSEDIQSSQDPSSQLQTKLVSSSSPTTTTQSMELASLKHNHQQHAPPLSTPPKTIIKREGNRRGPTSGPKQEGSKTPDPKILRRLAQNREAARGGQGILFGGDQGGGMISADAAVFDMEYVRWLEEHSRLMCKLRAAVQEHLPENELRLFVDNSLAHYDELMNLKSMIAKTDVFHLVSGTWMTPSERCFTWLGGFRPSDLIKITSSEIDVLTEQQVIGIYRLQQSTQEAEEALSQGLEALNQSVSDTITASGSLSFPPNMSNYVMGQMAVAINKLSTLECFVRQAENLRQQTLHRLHQILSTCQVARYVLAFAEYFNRFRALSSLWFARPRQE